MSSTLISCVRKNSPPLELASTQGGLSSLTQQGSSEQDAKLIVPTKTPKHYTTPVYVYKKSANRTNLLRSNDVVVNNHNIMDDMLEDMGDSSSNTPTGGEEQQKRRRFRPLHNLKRIFRRRTITATTTKDLDSTEPPCYNGNECKRSKNIIIGSDSCLSTVISNISASAPNSSSSIPYHHHHHQHSVEETQTHLAKTLPKQRNSYQSLLTAQTSDHNHQQHFLLQSADQQTLEGNHFMRLTRNEDELPVKHLVTKKKNAEHCTINISANEIELSTRAIATTTTTATANNCHRAEQCSDANMSATNIRYSQQNPMNHNNYTEESVMGGGGLPTVHPTTTTVASQRHILTMQCSALHNSIDSLHDVDGNGSNDSGTGGCTNVHNNSRLTVASAGSEKPAQRYGEMMNSNRRSLSEGLLIDSACSHELLSQSHDSVFSDSVTASSLSITLKAELANALRKRNAHRAEASDEDLGLPHSPSSADRQATHYAANISSGSDSGINKSCRSTESKISTSIQSDRSLSLLSINSADMENALMSTSTAISSSMIQATEKNQVEEFKQLASISSTSLNVLQNVATKENFDEADFCCSKVASLSHVAAKHKLSVKPTKKKIPSRRHRRALEVALMDGTVDLDKLSDYSLGFNRKEDEIKNKELPLHFNTSLSKEAQVPLDSASTLTITSNINTSAFPKFKSEYSSKDNEKSSDVLQRPTQKHFLTDNQKSANSVISIEDKIIHTEQYLNAKAFKYQPKWGSTPLLNSSEHFASKDKINNRKFDIQTAQKSKTGPASRQRYLPQNISNESLNHLKTSTIDKDKELRPTIEDETREKITMHSVSNSSSDGKPKRILEDVGEIFHSTSIIKEITSSHPLHISSAYPAKKEHSHHFERKVKMSTLSAFQQKISRSNDAFLTNSNSSIASVNYFDKCEPIDADNVKNARCPFEQQNRRKSIEKSKSFRAYGGYSKTKPSTQLLNNVPSLPDLTLNDHGDGEINHCYAQHSPDIDSSLLDIRINDNTNTDWKETKEANEAVERSTQPTTPLKSLIKSNLTTTNDQQNRKKTPTDAKPFRSVLDKNTTSITKPQSFEKIDDMVSNFSSRKLHSLHPNPNAVANSHPSAHNSQSEDKLLTSNRRANATKSMIITKSEEFSERSERKFFRVMDRNSIANFETSLDANGNVPEFMKIQLNRVDPDRLSKGHVVLAKNCPLKANEVPMNVTKQNPPAKVNNVIASHRMDTSNQECPFASENEDPNLKSTLETGASLSLQDRKRLLMAHEMDRNAAAKNRLQMDVKEHNSLVVKENDDGNEATASVVLRKHSFAHGNNNRGHQEDSTMHNSHNSHNIHTSNNAHISYKPNSEDAIPELIKVFARRSLKLKNEEELDKFITKNNPAGTHLNEKKYNNFTDADALNQFGKLNDIETNMSTVTKIITDPYMAVNLTTLASTISVPASNRSQQSNKIQNSMPLFSRSNGTKSLNENNSSATAAASLTYSNVRKSVFTPIKLNDVYRNSTNEELPLCNNNNNNNHMNSLGKLSYITQQSNIPTTMNTLTPSNTSVVTGTNINITISSKHNNNPINEEFKCIHQRRAEWEQRVKQALK